MLGRAVVHHSPAKLSRRKAKVATVMHEFKAGTLHSGSGAKVKSRAQAVAIAMSESGQSRDKASRRRKGY